MFGIINFELFLISAILLNLTPGTDTMYIISRSISQGKRAGVLSALGITSGSVIHTILAAFGLSIIIMKSIILFTMIKILGAIYLVYLGVTMILARKNTSQEEQATIKKMTHSKIFMQGLITNVTNPKVALFFLAFIPQFIQTEQFSAIPFLLLGLTFCLTGGIWCLLLATFSSIATTKLRKNTRFENLLNKVTGIIFIGMGLKLMTTKAS